MLSNILKPKTLLLGKTLVIAASSCFLGCTLDPYIITAEEEYTRNFIKSFGLIDAEQDWNLAKDATVSINLGPELCKSVKVYAKHQGKYYLVADLTDLSGQIDVPVDIPESSTDILVVTNGRKYYGNLGSPIDCSDLSRGIPNSTYDSDGTNPNPAVFEKTENGYTLTVQHTTRGNGKGTIYEQYNDNGAYQYFNTQQISPLISTTPWDTYYSANTQKWTTNPGNWIGLLPESGVFNRPKKELEDWLTKEKNEGHSIVEDFRISTGDDGSFTLFPYYYGTNLKHELGVYLLDDNGNPLLKNGGTYNSSTDYSLDDFISFPVFVDRHPGDLQVQPHYDSAITGIRLKDGYPEFTLGENFDLQAKVEIEREGDGWMSYADYIKKYGSLYHSRVAYHFWVDEPNDDMTQRPDSFARIYNNGIVTPLKITKNHNEEGIAYANVAIQTGLENSNLGNGIGRIKGRELDFTYKVLAGSVVKSIDIAESDLKMCVGETRILNVTLKDKNGSILPLEDYFNEISVTGEWDTDKCQIYKDESSKTIKLTAKGSGECWPRVYVTETGWDGTFDYVHVLTSPHHITKEYTGASEAITLSKWQEYFKTSDEYKTDVTAEIFAEAGENEGYKRTYTNEAEKWATRKLDSGIFKDADNTYKLRIKIDSERQLGIISGWWGAISCDYIVNGVKYSITGEGENENRDYKTIAATEFDILLNDAMLEILKEQGISFQNASDGNITFLKVELVRPLQEGEEAQHDWISDGKKNVADYLASHYKGDTGTTCDYCGKTFDFSNITPVVSIMDDAGYDNIHYTVTWEQPSGTYSVSKHKPSALSRSVSSREYDSTASHLNPGKASDWRDVNSFWSRLLPHQEEVASYPPNVCMLARSRGYDVTITYGKDENGNPKPWKGNLGMYLKVLGSYDIVDPDYSENYQDIYTEYKKGSSDKSKQEYVVFSQKRFNKAANGDNSDQISALSVKHPMSGRTFLTFEDMRLTKPGVTPADFKEKSSDRDVNDLIFNITNFGGISNDEEEIKEDPEDPTDETFTWMWAVEDLGDTDDFDFNDMVMKITSVTRNVNKKDPATEGGSTTVTLFKKVTFEPLCAGGTLPLYVHYNPSEGVDYTLAPGVYREKGLEGELDSTEIPTEMSYLESGASDSEIHSWFGNYPYTLMINTTGDDVKKAKTCVLYLNTAFKIGNYGKGQTLKGTNGGLYVTVNDGRSVDFINEITGWKLSDDGESWAIGSTGYGKPAQMFMIVDPDIKWRWPKERVHILQAYPKFKEWAGSVRSDRWYDLDGNNEGFTCPRHD